MNYMLLVPLLLPLIAAFAAYRTGKRKWIVLSALAVNAAVFAYLCTLSDPELVLWRMTSRINVALRLDAVGKWFGMLVSAVWFIAGIYSFSYMEEEKDLGRFFCFYMLTLMALEGLCLSANIVTLYMFYELMTLLSVPLVMHEMTPESVAAGIKYLLYSVLGASLALCGAFFFQKYGSIEFKAGGVLTGVSGHAGTLLTAVFLMLLGFGVKAGMFPLHGWLPTAHPVAPAPASAVLSGVITKAGVLGAIRVVFYLGGADFIRGTWVQYTWMTLALITVFMGSMMAYREDVLKKRLAYSTVSQVSYVLFGLSTLTPIGFVGACLHVVFHSVIKNGLFMCAGSIIHKTGKTRVSEMNGIGKRLPVTMWGFTLLSAGLIGIPPTAGFISKWYLAQGSLSMSGTFAWMGPVVLLVSAILTAGYLLSVAIHGFFPGRDFDYSLTSNAEPAFSMVVPVVLLAACTLFFGMFPHFFVEIASVIPGGLGL